MTPTPTPPSALETSTPSCGAPLELPASGASVAADYAAALLTRVGARVVRSPGHGTHEGDLLPAFEWARSGAMALTGFGDGPPLLAPGPLASCARGAVMALSLLAGDDWVADLDGPALLGEHAAIWGLRRRGTTSPSRSCRQCCHRPKPRRWRCSRLRRPTIRTHRPPRKPHRRPPRRRLPNLRRRTRRPLLNRAHAHVRISKLSQKQIIHRRRRSHNRTHNHRH